MQEQLGRRLADLIGWLGNEGDGGLDERRPGGFVKGDQRYVVGIDIATNKICCLIAEARESGGADVTGIGTSPSLSGMVTSLALNRRELPSGPRTTQVYKRLGYDCGREGRPSVSGMVGGDIAILKWRFQHLAITRCTPEIDPGGKACKACPLRKFCRANREARNTTRNRRRSTTLRSRVPRSIQRS